MVLTKGMLSTSNALSLSITLDGSNWELLCIYCHENEHARVLDESLLGRVLGGQAPVATHNPFADLQAKLNQKK